MTVPATTRKAGPFTGTGLVTVFPFGFKVFTTADVKVVQADDTGAETTLSSGFTVALNADQVASPGGTVTLSVALPTGYKLSILGNLPYDQTLAIPGGGNYNPVAHENALDRLVGQLQQIYEIATRSLVQAATGSGSATLPSGVAFNVLGWDAAGASLQNYNPGALGVAISYANWTTTTFNGDGATAAFALPTDAGAASNIELAVSGVVQTAGINFSYTSATKTITFLTGAPPVGTNNVRARYGQALPGGAIPAASISDSTAVGRAVLTAVDAAAGRTALSALAAGDNIGSATATTQSPGDNSTRVATTAYADAVGAAGSSTQIQPISASVAANALTISASALSLDFRSTTLGSGTVTRVAGTPSSLVVPSSATLGTVSAQTSRLVVLALNNAGAIELAVVNIAGANDLTETGLISTTAISAAATASNVVYSTTARTGVAYRVVGFVDSTQSTAGIWATAPSTVQGCGGQALADMSSIGYGQTWQSVTRTAGSTYYNTTGKPIVLSTYMVSNGVNSGIISITINGSYTMIYVGGGNAGGAGNVPAVGTVIIPPRASYVITPVNVSAKNDSELR